MTTQIPTDPQTFINELFDIDESSAVRVAHMWCGTDASPAQYRAACTIRERQTVFPLCEHCDWPILNKDEHANCGQAVANAMGIDCTNCHDRGCIRCDPRFDDFEDEDDNCCPHCGSTSCDTWACQQ